MLSSIFFGLVALTQFAPSNSMPASGQQPNVSPNFARDLATAKQFAKTVTGPKHILANWTKSGDDLCSWKGFLCDTLPKSNALALAGVEFNGFKLTGNLKLQGFLDKLLDLAFFHANSNGFAGSIPSLTGSKYLDELDFSNNKLSGPFPRSLLSSPNFTFLDLRYNNFNGNLPSEVFTTFTSIEALFMNDNQFSGELPHTIGHFAGNYLTLDNNQFKGCIPPTLPGAKNLIEFRAENNTFSGSIPTGLGALSQLEVFSAAGNLLTGHVPEDLCAIKSIKHINLSRNHLNHALGPKCTKVKKAGILKI